MSTPCSLRSELVMMEVDVPAGLCAGDEMCVMVGDQELVVLVPAGCMAGDTIKINVPPSEPAALLVDVVVPPTSRPGEQLEVTIDGTTMTFTVPKDCVPGSPVSIAIPQHAKYADNEAGSSSATDLPSTSLLPSVAQPGLGEAPPQSKFWVGLEVSVLRTDGRRTFGIVEATDWASATYTLRMNDGRMKHMVGEADLEHLWAGKYRTGDPVTVRMGRRSREGRITSHDDEDGTYGVIFGDGETVDGVKRTSITQQVSPGME